MSAEKQSRLCEIHPSNWTALRDKFLIDWPKNMLGFYTMDNFVRWIAIEPNIEHLRVYALNGDWSDGTFVVVDRYQLFLNSLNESNERLTVLLSLLDWSHGFKVSTFLGRHRAAVTDVVKQKQLTCEFDSHTILYYLPKEDGIRIQTKLPDGITLGPLSESDAEKADAVWPNKHVGSMFFLKRLAKWNPNVGVYAADGELVAWSFRLQAGPVGALQVADKHQGRGLGTVALQAITNQIAQLGHDIYGCVSRENHVSRNLFEKVGFKYVDDTYWLRTYPTVPFEWTD